MKNNGNYNGSSQTITEVLGGNKGQTIADRIIDKNNPLSGLAIDFDIAAAEDLFGKVVSDLQEDMVVSGGAITGTSKYVTGYTGFSGNPEEQEGNYIALHVSVPNMTIGQDGLTVKVNGSTLDSDGLIVLIFKGSTRPIKVVATKGDFTKIREFKTTGIVKEPKPEETPGEE